MRFDLGEDRLRFELPNELVARLGATADLALTTALSRLSQQRSTLEAQLGDLMSTYLDPVTGRY